MRSVWVWALHGRETKMKGEKQSQRKDMERSEC